MSDCVYANGDSITNNLKNAPTKKLNIIKRDISGSDDEDFQLIDVASFIQKPDYYQLDAADANMEHENSQLEGLDTSINNYDNKYKNYDLINYKENNNLQSKINDEINGMYERNHFGKDAELYSSSDKPVDVIADKESIYKGMTFPFFSFSNDAHKVRKKSKHKFSINGEEISTRKYTTYESTFKFYKKRKRSHVRSCTCDKCRRNRIKKETINDKRSKYHLDTKKNPS